MAEQIGNEDRRAELAANLTRVRERIRAASEAAGRADEPELIVVTKFHPASDVRLLAELGVTDVGENRDQEASAKASELAGLPLTWHFIGQLQTNKAKSVVRYADVIHSLDRPALVSALGKAAARAGLQDLACLVQVNLDPDAASGRGGALPDEVPALAHFIDDTPGLRIVGVMAVAPLGADPAEAFARLSNVSAGVKARFPAATMVSAGMSQDLEAAVAAGATHLRIGTDVLGARPTVG